MKSSTSSAQRADHIIHTKNCREQAAVIPTSLLYDLYFSQPTSVKIQILENAIDFHRARVDWFDLPLEPYSEGESKFYNKEMARFNSLVSKLHRTMLQLANLRAETPPSCSAITD